MKNFIEIKKTLASNWFKFLQEKIVEEFELLEKNIRKRNLPKENGIKIIKRKAAVYLAC